MKWIKLTDKDLEKLKDADIDVLVLAKDDFAREYQYDIINFMDLKNLGLSRIEQKHHWNSFLHTEHPNCKQDTYYEYTDEELMHIFTHYCVIDKIPGE